MRIVWDERKRLANIEKHRCDFADLTLEFFVGAAVRPARLGRFQAIGRWREGVPVSVVFARLGAEAVSIVSMRPASTTERKLL